MGAAPSVYPMREASCWQHRHWACTTGGTRRCRHCAVPGSKSRHRVISRSINAMSRALFHAGSHGCGCRLLPRRRTARGRCTCSRTRRRTREGTGGRQTRAPRMGSCGGCGRGGSELRGPMCALLEAAGQAGRQGELPGQPHIVRWVARLAGDSLLLGTSRKGRLLMKRMRECISFKATACVRLIPVAAWGLQAPTIL